MCLLGTTKIGFICWVREFLSGTVRVDLWACWGRLWSSFTFFFFSLFAGLQHQGIFRVSGSQLEVNDIKNSFERGTKYGSCWMSPGALNYLCLCFRKPLVGYDPLGFVGIFDWPIHLSVSKETILWQMKRIIMTSTQWLAFSNFTSVAWRTLFSPKRGLMTCWPASVRTHTR